MHSCSSEPSIKRRQRSTLPTEVSSIKVSCQLSTSPDNAPIKIAVDPPFRVAATVEDMIAPEEAKVIVALPHPRHAVTDLIDLMVAGEVVDSSPTPRLLVMNTALEDVIDPQLLTAKITAHENRDSAVTGASHRVVMTVVAVGVAVAAPALDLLRVRDTAPEAPLATKDVMKTFATDAPLLRMVD